MAKIWGLLTIETDPMENPNLWECGVCRGPAKRLLNPIQYQYLIQNRHFKNFEKMWGSFTILEYLSKVWEIANLNCQNAMPMK